MREMHVCIVASKSGVLYVGVTSDLIARIQQHKEKQIPGFTAKYNVNLLVYYEAFPEPMQAIEAEKRIKGWTRAKKTALIESKNPTWKDLYYELVDEGHHQPEILRGAQNDGSADIDGCSGIRDSSLMTTTRLSDWINTPRT